MPDPQGVLLPEPYPHARTIHTLWLAVQHPRVFFILALQEQASKHLCADWSLPPQPVPTSFTMQIVFFLVTQVTTVFSTWSRCY